jgi:hypothetical protein
MDIRYFIDPETELPHIYRHDVTEEEVEDVLRRPIEDRPGREGSRVALGRSETGRYLRIVYVPDPIPGSVFVITAYPLGWGGAEGASSPAEEEAMKQSKYPVGWDEERVRRVLEHYEAQSDEEAVAEDEAAYEATTYTMMEVPVELVPVVRELIAKRKE